MNGLDLFSGIGGFAIGLREYIKTVAYCEADKYAQSVLLSRMSDRSIENAPIWDDIRTLTGDMFDTPIDIIVGGFPCQDISVAGTGKGLAGKRSGLFYEVCRLVQEIKPSFVFLENVPAIRTRGLREVIREFTDMGYGCRWTCVSAAEVGARHLRKRWFLLAYSKCGTSGGECCFSGLSKNQGWRQTTAKQPTLQSQDEETRADNSKSSRETLADTDSKRLEGGKQSATTWETFARFGCSGWWQTEPDVGRVANGVSSRVDRIKCLGNAVVPLQAKIAFERLIGLN